MVRLPYFSLPNLLAGEKLVPEFFQGAVRGTALADSLQVQLADASRRAMLSERFRAIHVALRCGGAAQAATRAQAHQPGLTMQINFWPAWMRPDEAHWLAGDGGPR